MANPNDFYIFGKLSATRFQRRHLQHRRPCSLQPLKIGPRRGGGGYLAQQKKTHLRNIREQLPRVEIRHEVRLGADEGIEVGGLVVRPDDEGDDSPHGNDAVVPLPARPLLEGPHLFEGTKPKQTEREKSSCHHVAKVVHTINSLYSTGPKQTERIMLSTLLKTVLTQFDAFDADKKRQRTWTGRARNVRRLHSTHNIAQWWGPCLVPDE